METMAASPDTSLVQHSADPRAGKYLTFSLGNEEFAIHVLRVREIIGALEITAVPQMPAYVKGVINLRGTVIPVIDLRLKFGLAEVEQTQRTSIIVVQIALAHTGNGRSLQIGIIVDAVSEVLTIQGSEIENTPDFGSDVAPPYLIGMAKIKGGVKILLDINQVLSRQEATGLGSL